MYFKFLYSGLLRFKSTSLSEKIGYNLKMEIATLTKAFSSKNKERLKNYLKLTYRELYWANAAFQAHKDGKKVIFILGINHGRSPIMRYVMREINGKSK